MTKKVQEGTKCPHYSIKKSSTDPSSSDFPIIIFMNDNFICSTFNFTPNKTQAKEDRSQNNHWFNHT